MQYCMSHHFCDWEVKTLEMHGKFTYYVIEKFPLKQTEITDMAKNIRMISGAI